MEPYKPMKLVAADCDDTIAPHPDESGRRVLAPAYKARRELVRFPHVTYAALTGQSRNDVLPLIKAAGIRGPCAYEMGYLFGEDPDQQPVHLAEIDRSLAQRHPEIHDIEGLRRFLASDGFFEMVRNDYGFHASLMPKAYLLSIRHHDRRAGEFNNRLLQLLERYSGAAALQGYLRDGIVEVSQFRDIATDIRPRVVGKELPLKLIMDKTGAGRNETLVVGDSGGDRKMFEHVYSQDQYQRGYAACPANATPEIVKLVRSFGRKGIVSEVSCRDGGFADILQKAEERGWFG